MIPDIGGVSNAKIVSYQDASFANLRGGGSQGGYIIFVLGENSKYVPICWKSKKVKRVVRSTLSAETLALVGSIEECFLIKTMLMEILNLSKDALPIISVTDNASLVESAYSTKTLADKRLNFDMCIIRQMLSNNEVNEIRWIENGDQIADCLAEKGASNVK